MNKQTTGKAHVRRELRVRARPRIPRSWPLVSAIAAAAALASACGGDDDDDAARARRRWWRRASRSSASTPSATKRSGPTRCACTRSSRAAVDPTTALSVGLKVDADALPPAVVARHPERQHRPHSPATTVALLKLDAVVGLKGTVETVNGVRHADARRHHLRAVPLDGRRLVRARHRQAARRLAQPRPEPRRDHRVVAGARRAPQGRSSTPGARASTTRATTSTASTSRSSSRRPTGSTAFTASPSPATATRLAYWNRYVAVTQMGGLGTMLEPRLNLNITNGTQDLVSDKLPALQAYQLRCRAGRRRRAASTPPPRRAASWCSKARHLRQLPQRRSCSPTPTRGCIRRPIRWPSPRSPSYAVALGHQAVPHLAAEGRLAARAVLPRRLGGDAGRCRRRPTTASGRSA